MQQNHDGAVRWTGLAIEQTDAINRGGSVVRHDGGALNCNPGRLGSFSLLSLIVGYLGPSAFPTQPWDGSDTPEFSGLPSFRRLFYE